MAELTSNVHEMRGRNNVAHIPPMPLWVAIIRALQAILAIIIVGLTAFAASVFKYAFSGYGMAWFTFIWTILFLAYISVTSTAMTTLYNMWIHLGLEVATTFWWLVTFALLASEANAWGFAEGTTYLDYYGNTQSIDAGLPPKWKSAINCAKAAAGLGALEWVLFIITLIMFGITLRRHRLAHGMGNAAAAPPGAPVMDEHKMQPIGTNQPVPVQQQYYQQQQATGPSSYEMR